MKNPKRLIGKKVKGFNFEDDNGNEAEDYYNKTYKKD